MQKKYKKHAKKSVSNIGNIETNNNQANTSHTKVKQTSVNILSTNAGGLRHKSSDLQNKIRFFKSSIFSVQECYYAKKGKFVMDQFIIFEAIRKC